MLNNEIFIVAAVRTAIGGFGGSLKDVPLSELAQIAVKGALERGGIAPQAVGHVVMGTVVPTEPKDAYLARVAAMGAGIPSEVPAFNVSRLCGSGLQAIISGVQIVAAGDAQIVVAGGAESMSRGVYISQASRWGARLGNSTLVDYVLDVLHDPFHRIHMGMTAENVAKQEGITRAMQDELALESQRRAARALAEGRFVSQIVPVDIKSKKGVIRFELDEHVRGDITAEQLAKMRPAFKEGGTVTAGNSSGLNDGASALVLASAAAVRTDKLKPLARLVAYAHAGVDPTLMGLGPIPATQAALKRAGLQASDMSVVESNEAFAAQACAVTRRLGLDPAVVNPNGSGISMGHPVGATGAIIATKAIHELHRIGGRYALTTMCIGGGQGIAAIFERT